LGHRLSKIVTRTGDSGETGLGDGSRTPKDGPRIEAIGAVDELNSDLGVLLAEELPAGLRECLLEVQHDLFDLGGELSIPGYTGLKEAQVSRIEEVVERFNSTLPPLKEFILPGGGRTAALAHVCRTVCRRAERRVVALIHADPDHAPGFSLQYLNRLSDLMFVLARVLNREAGRDDVLWRHDRG
jgi:cob(I)alamin adenosyltransferase